MLVLIEGEQNLTAVEHSECTNMWLRIRMPPYLLLVGRNIMNSNAWRRTNDHALLVESGKLLLVRKKPNVSVEWMEWWVIYDAVFVPSSPRGGVIVMYNIICKVFALRGNMYVLFYILVVRDVINSGTGGGERNYHGLFGKNRRRFSDDKYPVRIPTISTNHKKEHFRLVPLDIQQWTQQF